MFTKNLKRYCLVFLLCVATTSLTYAQTAVDGAIGGTVEDASGSVLPNAQITIRNNGTNATQTATSDSTGYFRFIHLQPGSYTATITAAGFKTYSNQAVVEVGLLTDLTSKLPASSANETVQVTNATPVINTSSPDFTGMIDQHTLTNLPVNNYRWSSFSLLTPGVVGASDGFGLLSFRGQPTIQNNITFDGADDNQAFFGEERGRTRAGYSTPQYAVQEFQVNTSNYTAEYGRATGGVVNSITKSGTNTLHGEVYFFDRDNEWGSKNPFVLVATPNSSGVYGAPTVFKPKDWRKQSGVGIGGPIIKDRLFFFFAFDDYKRNFPSTAIANSVASFTLTPDPGTPLTTGGAATTCAGTGATAPTTIDAAACTLATNVYGSSSPTNYQLAAGTTAASQGAYGRSLSALTTGLFGQVPRTGDQQIFLPKIDWQINSRNHATVELSRLRWASPSGVQTSSVVANGIASSGNDFVKLTFGVAKLDTVITDHIANELRYQYGRDFEYENNQTETPYEAATLPNTVGGSGIPPNVNLGTFQFGTPTFLNRGRYPDERRWQIADTANWSAGHHSIKFGIDFLNTTDAIQNLVSQYGGYTYATLAAYFSDYTITRLGGAGPGVIANHYTSYAQAVGPIGFEFATQDYGAFIEDQWKVTPRLSLTLGVRYDYEQLPSPYANLVNVLIPQTATFHADRNNVGPRVGFAYDVYGSGKTVVRGGAGIFYGRILNGTIFKALTGTGNVTGIGTGNPVSQLTLNFSSPAASGAPTAFPQVLTPAGTVPPPSIAYFDPNVQNPYVYQADLTVQQDLGWSTVLSISYLGAMGRDLLQFRDANLPTTSSATPETTVTYNVVDPSHLGPLPNGSTITTNFYPKTTSAVCGLPTGEAGTSNRPNCAYGSMTDMYSGLNSSYHAFVIQIEHRLSHHLSFTGNYTWSHAMDFGVNSSTSVDSNDLLDANAGRRSDYGNANTNVPNRGIVYMIYQTPWKVRGIFGYLANDFEAAPSFAVQSGLPYSYSTSGTPATATFTNSLTTPLQAPIGSGMNGSGGGPANGGFTTFRIPGLGRNTLQQPNTQVLDLRLSKRFTIHERFKVELLGEVFNLMNHQNVTAVQGITYALSTTGSTLASNKLTFSNASASTGLFSNTTALNNNLAYSTRQVQLGARLQF